jgi:hypothetical protein
MATTPVAKISELAYAGIANAEIGDRVRGGGAALYAVLDREG